MLAPMTQLADGLRGSVLEVSTMDPPFRISLPPYFAAMTAPQNRNPKKSLAPFKSASPIALGRIASPAVKTR
jgi:hypothetical protein